MPPPSSTSGSAPAKHLLYSNTFCSSENGLYERQQASYALCDGQNRPHEPPQAGNKFAAVKTDSPSFYKVTIIAAIKTDLPNLYKLQTSFAAVKTEIYKPPTHFTVEKTHYTNLCKLHTRLACGRQNGLHDPLQASNKLCCRQNVLPKLLYKSPKSFPVVKTDSQDFYKRPTRVAVVRTDSTNIYKLHTYFAVDKTDSPSLYKLPTAFAAFETDTTNLHKPLDQAQNRDGQMFIKYLITCYWEGNGYC